MRRRTIAALALALAGAAGAESAAAPSRDALVQPGRAIGRVRLGMTQAEVRRVLGGGAIVAKRRELGFGQRYVRLEWGYGAWTVGFQGRAGRLRAVMVGTTVRTQRTRSNLGVGSRIRDILRVYPHATCSGWPGLGSESSKETWIVVRHPSRAQTVFVAVGDGKAEPGPLRMAGVMVRVPASGLVERRSSCGPNWRRF